MRQHHETRDKVLDAAEKRMIKYGFRKVTMDEIASDLRMSKNTIYKEFAGKEDIAKGLVKRLQQHLNAGLDNIEKKEKDPVKIFSGSVFLLRKELGPWFDVFFKEIPVEVPGLWEEFLRFRNEKILAIHRFIEKGSRQGIFRQVDPSIATEAYLGAVKAVTNPRFLQQEQLDFDRALEAILDIWSHGIIKHRR